MFFAFLLTVFALALFALVNLFAALLFIAGLIILVALRLRRRGEFWFLLLGAASLGGGSGAISASYGAYFAATELWPDSIWPFVAWNFGYIAGGIGGALLLSFFVVLRRQSELSQVVFNLKNRFHSTKNQMKRFGFRQTLRVGAWTLRCALFKRADSKT